MLNNKFKEQLKGREIAIEDLNKLLEHRSEIHKITLIAASLKTGELSDEIKCLKEKDSQIPRRNELLEEEQNTWRSLEKKRI